MKNPNKFIQTIIITPIIFITWHIFVLMVKYACDYAETKLWVTIFALAFLIASFILYFNKGFYTFLRKNNFSENLLDFIYLLTISFCFPLIVSLYTTALSANYDPTLPSYLWKTLLTYLLIDITLIIAFIRGKS